MEIKKLDITQSSDFHYLLELMLPLYDMEEFAWLPELFSIVGAEKLITLCKYAGGEVIRIPTLDELSTSIETLQFFYDIKIKKTKTLKDLPPVLLEKYNTICEVYLKDA